MGRELTAADVRRYSRQLVIPEIGNVGQRLIANARVLCIGAGGLGSPVLLYLAAAGVGNLGVVDFDIVDETNLQRQIIHGQSDIGRRKVESAKAKIHEIDPSVVVDIFPIRLDGNNVLELFSNYDVIVDATDNFATRYLINDACVILKKPWVMGSIYRFDGQVTVFWSEHGPCYRCIYPDPPPKGLVANCAEAGVIGSLCASIGSIQTTETLKLITGIGRPLVGKIVFYNGLESTFETVEISKDQECAMCKESSQAHLLEDYDVFCGLPSQSEEISAEQLALLLRTDKELQLVDVREKFEWEQSHIEGAILIPLTEFYSGRAQEKISNNRHTILYCHRGNRSADALNVLKGAGYDGVAHLQGGIVSWNEYISNV